MLPGRPSSSRPSRPLEGVGSERLLQGPGVAPLAVPPVVTIGLIVSVYVQVLAVFKIKFCSYIRHLDGSEICKTRPSSEKTKQKLPACPCSCSLSLLLQNKHFLMAWLNFSLNVGSSQMCAFSLSLISLRGWVALCLNWHRHLALPLSS